MTLIKIIENFFRPKLFVRTSDDSNLNELTLSHAYDNHQQLIVIYRNDSFVTREFFRSRDFPTPWPNVTNTTNLRAFLDQRLEFRAPNQGFVSQCVLTPDTSYILPRFYSSIRRSCAKKVDKKMEDWIKSQTPGRFQCGEKPTSNVFLADYVDIRKNNFSKIVIDLNMKLMEFWKIWSVFLTFGGEINKIIMIEQWMLEDEERKSNLQKPNAETTCKFSTKP